MSSKITRQGWEALGSLIREQRNLKDLTLEDVVTLIKSRNPTATIGTNTLSNLERGTSEPKISTLMDISLIELVKDKKGVPLRVYDMIRLAEINSSGIDSRTKRMVAAEPVGAYSVAV